MKWNWKVREPRWVDTFRRKKNESGRTIVTAPDGYLFKVDRGTMLVRKRADAEIAAGILRVELKRCGWPTNKVKVRLFRVTDHAPALFYANIGVRRGLDLEAPLQRERISIRAVATPAVYREPSDYTLRFTVKTCANTPTGDGCAYHDATFHVGDLDGYNLKDITEPTGQLRTDYTAAEVTQLRKNIDEAEKAKRAAESALSPFSRYDQ